MDSFLNILLTELHHLFSSHPKQHFFTALRATLDYENSPSDRCGVCHCALGKYYESDFGLAARTGFSDYEIVNYPRASTII